MIRDQEGRYVCLMWRMAMQDRPSLQKKTLFLLQVKTVSVILRTTIFAFPVSANTGVLHTR